MNQNVNQEDTAKELITDKEAMMAAYVMNGSFAKELGMDIKELITDKEAMMAAYVMNGSFAKELGMDITEIDWVDSALNEENPVFFY